MLVIYALGLAHEKFNAWNEVAPQSEVHSILIHGYTQIRHVGLNN